MHFAIQSPKASDAPGRQTDAAQPNWSLTKRWALLIALVIWLVVIFLGFSLLAPANATNTLALMAGAFSVACAVFIILDLDHPFAGVVRIPSEPMIRTLDHLSNQTG